MSASADSPKPRQPKASEVKSKYNFALECKGRLVRLALNTLSIVSLFVSWEIVAISGYFNSALFPTPIRVASDLAHMMVGQQLWADIYVSSNRLFVGFMAGALLGLISGLLTGRYMVLEYLISPIFQMLRPIPPISFVPIAILWFGLGEFSKYFLIVWGVFFPVWFNTHLGVKRVDQTLVRAALCLGENKLTMLATVILPAALPQILAGLRTSIAVSFYCLVAAEIAGAYSGVAYRIDIAHLNFQTGRMFAGLVVLGIMSALSDGFFVVATRWAFPWAYRTT